MKLLTGACCSLSLLVLLACQPEEPIKIGFLAGLSGPSSALGTEARQTLELLVKDFNEKGGVAGRRVSLLVEDDGGTAAQTIKALEHLRSERVAAVIGPMTSTSIAEVLEFVNKYSLPTVSPTVSSSAASGRPDWFFRVISGNREMGITLADYAVSTGLREVSVLRETSNEAYTKPILEAFEERFTAAGGKVQSPVLFRLSEHPNYRILSKKLGKSPGYLVLANGFDCAQIGQALAADGQLGPVFAPPWSMTSELITLGGRQVERIAFASIYDSQNQDIQWITFRDRFETLFGREPGFASVYTHDAFDFLMLSLTQARSTDPEKLRAAMVGLGPVSGMQSQFQLDEFGDVIRPLIMMTVRDGKFVRTDR